MTISEGWRMVLRRLQSLLHGRLIQPIVTLVLGALIGVGLARVGAAQPSMQSLGIVDSVPPVEVNTSAPRAMMQEIRWPELRAANKAVLDSLSASEQEKINRSMVPVLLPQYQELLSSAALKLGPRRYSAHMHQEDIQVLIKGRQVVYEYPGMQPPPEVKVRGLTAYVRFSEGMWSISWQEFGVYYVLELECGQRDDPRCADDRYLRSVAESLVFLGGSSDRVSS